MNSRPSKTALAILSFAALALALPPPTAVACSFFMCARNGEVLAGNNEDYRDPYTKMWFVPGEDADYGRVYFGFFNDFPQGGMNEAGLFFDGAALSRRKVPEVPGREVYGEGNLVDEVMSTCATVPEVIEMFERFQAHFLDRAQLQFADAEGDSVIIEGERILRKTGDYQITTNFRQAEVPQDASCPCPRYRTIDRMLGAGETPTVEQFARILGSVHQEGKVSTLYSSVYDLKRTQITLYHFHNFQEPVQIDLVTELEKGPHQVVLHELFPETFAFQTFRARYDAEQEKSSGS